MENSLSTVLTDILPTSDQPDIMFLSKDKEITIIKLTVPFNSPDCINAVHEYKVSKYQLLLSRSGSKKLYLLICCDRDWCAWTLPQ